MNLRFMPACVVLAFACHPLSADVAPPCSYTLTQPDGFTFEARAFGDERACRVETMDGRVIVDVPDGDGNIRWYYAVLIPDRSCVASGTPVGPDTVPGPFSRAEFEARHREPMTRSELRPLSQADTRILRAPADPHQSFRPIVFLVNFPSGLPPQGSRLRYTKDHFTKLIFAEGLDPASTSPPLPATYTRSLRDYYAEVSSGRFIIEGSADSVIDWTTTQHPYDYYVDGNQGKGMGAHGKARSAAAICVELAQAVNGVVNFANFDGDADGVVDVVILLIRGMASTGAVNQFSSFMDTIFSVGSIDAAAPRDARGFLLLDGVIIKNIVVTTEQAYEDGFQDFRRGDPQPIGTLCHELGHVIGLPDLYDLAVYTTGNAASGLVTSAGIGRWGLMGYGVWYRQTSPAYLCAWSRARMGWVVPETRATDVQTAVLSLPPCEVNDVVYKVPIPAGGPSEYFLLENRRRLGSDQYLKGEGLLIWHVDENFTDLFPASNTVNNIESTPGVNLMQADGAGDLYRDLYAANSNSGDAGDPFPGSTGNTQFSDDTVPGARAYEYDRDADGIVDSVPNSGISLADIREESQGAVSCVVTHPGSVYFDVGYDERHYEGVHLKWGENRSGILVTPPVSRYLRSIRTIFRNDPPAHQVNSYTIRIWRGFDPDTWRPVSLIHSQSGTVSWAASHPERQGGWVTLPIQGDVVCNAGVPHYIEVQYTGPGDIMPYDGHWFTGKIRSRKSYWRAGGNDACSSFDYGDWNIHAIFQNAPQTSRR